MNSKMLFYGVWFSENMDFNLSNEKKYSMHKNAYDGVKFYYSHVN